MFVASASLALASVPHLYLAQTVQGSGSGFSCTNAIAGSFFNDQRNWGPAANQIGPASTVHLCGVWNAPANTGGMLTFQGSGSPGKPITVVAEPGLIMQAPYWAEGGAISVSGIHDFVLDGAHVGIIRATANGTRRANQAPTCTSEHCSSAIWVQLSDNGSVRGWTIADIYVSVGASGGFAGDETPESYAQVGIMWNGGQNIDISDNIIHDVKWAVFHGAWPGAVNKNITISRNTIYNIDHGVFSCSDNTGASLDGLYIWGNTIHDAAMWDELANNKHHDGIHAAPCHPGSPYNNVFIYSNHIYGDWGFHCNTLIYLSPGPGITMTNAFVFNNLLRNQSAANTCSNGMIQDYETQNAVIVNNTMIGSGIVYPPPFGGNSGIITSSSARAFLRNNLFINMAEGIYSAPGSAVPNSDYNVFSPVREPNFCCVTLAQWQASGQDLHSSLADPLLSAAYIPGAGGSAVGKGANLTSLNISPLAFDFNGAPRGATWDIGAFNAGAAVPPPPPPPPPVIVPPPPPPPTGCVVTVRGVVLTYAAPC